MGEPLICVPPADVAKLWLAVEPFIVRAYEHADEFMPVDMLARLQDGRNLLWVSAPDGRIEMVLLTSLRRRPSGLSLRIDACAGSNMSGWLANLAQIEKYARDEGCVKVFADGRPGWARVMHGYGVKRVLVEKEMSDVRRG